MNRYRCYVKDQMNLTSKPKSFMDVDSFNISEDLLTNATSKINVFDVKPNINVGDVLVLYSPEGTTIYQGVINSIEDKTINTSQMQSFYKGNWVYNTDTGIIPSSFDHKYAYKQYQGYGQPQQYPTLETIKNLTEYGQTQYINEDAMGSQLASYVNGYGYVCGYFWCRHEYKMKSQLWTLATGTLKINGKVIQLDIVEGENDFQKVEIELHKGFNTYEAVFIQGYGTNYWFGAYPDATEEEIADWTRQYNRNVIGVNSSFTRDHSYLEDEIASLLTNYKDGKLYDSTYIDLQVATRLSGISVSSVQSQQNVHLLSDQTYEVMDFENFIYDLYAKYLIKLNFAINYEGSNSVQVITPNYQTRVIGDNIDSIIKMNPITKLEETNKLVIFSNENEYRATYVLLNDGTIVKEPSTTTNRFDFTNTKIVFSDDNDSDLIANNLPKTLYNHKITFDLLLDNIMYKFDDFHLGMPLEIHHGLQTYNSILTGYNLKKDTNETISVVTFTCGLVRTKLTKLLTLDRIGGRRR